MTCLGEKTTRRLVQRHLWQDALDQTDAFTKSPRGRRLYQFRKQTIELSFAEAKENHGFRSARMLGLANMREQSFLTAPVQKFEKNRSLPLSPFDVFQPSQMLKPLLRFRVTGVCQWSEASAAYEVAEAWVISQIMPAEGKITMVDQARL